MRSRTVASLLIGMSLIVACGDDAGGDDAGGDDAGGQAYDYGEINEAWILGSYLGGAMMTFVAPESNSILQMDADGTDVQPFVHQITPPEPWPDLRKLLNNVCGGYRSDKPVDDPIELISPDGASLDRKSTRLNSSHT